MATKITIALEDDLEGGLAAESLRFRADGAEYEIVAMRWPSGARGIALDYVTFVGHGQMPGPHTQSVDAD